MHTMDPHGARVRYAQELDDVPYGGPGLIEAWAVSTELCMKRSMYPEGAAGCFCHWGPLGALKFAVCIRAPDPRCTRNGYWVLEGL